MEQSISSLASPSNTPSFSIRLSTQQPHLATGLPAVNVVAPSLTVSGFPGLAFATTMSQAAFGSVPTNVRFQTNPSLSPVDPPAAGPSVAAMPATNRLRAAVIAAGSAQAAAAAAPTTTRRTTRSRRAAPAAADPLRSAAERGVAAARLSAPDRPPRRSQRTRKRAPTKPSNDRDSPSKKQKRANLKSPPPSGKSDDSKPEETERTASCCICMDEPKPVDLASINGCDHLFCFECIEKWAERENTCPLCKVRFTKIDRVNKAKRKKGEPAKNTKKVKQKDQRSDIAPGAALEGLLASFAASANFPPSRVARLIFNGIGAGNPFAVLPGSQIRSRGAGAAAADRQQSLEDSLFSSDTDDDEMNDSFLPSGATAGPLGDLFRSMPRGPILFSSGAHGGPRGISVSFGDPPPGRSYASNGGDRNAGREAENPLEIEDDSEDEDDVEVVQVTRRV